MSAIPGSVRGLHLVSAPLLDLCPECGVKALVYRVAVITTTGPIKVAYNRMGSELGPNWAEVALEYVDDVIRCLSCDAERRDLAPIERRVVEVGTIEPAPAVVGVGE